LNFRSRLSREPPLACSFRIVFRMSVSPEGKDGNGGKRQKKENAEKKEKGKTKGKGGKKGGKGKTDVVVIVSGKFVGE
jgi:hypothetical protein